MGAGLMATSDVQLQIPLTPAGTDIDLMVNTLQSELNVRLSNAVLISSNNCSYTAGRLR